MIFAATLLLLSSVTLAEPVNINTADAATMASALEGIGSSRAEAIVAYRTENGPFQSVEELAQVGGIGEKILEANRANLTVGEAPSTATK
jgi:competence protein ComEA